MTPSSSRQTLLVQWFWHRSVAYDLISGIDIKINAYFWQLFFIIWSHSRIGLSPLEILTHSFHPLKTPSLGEKK